MKKKINVTLLICLIGLFGSHFINSMGIGSNDIPTITATTTVNQEFEGAYEVTRVVDGDTIVVNIDNIDTVVRMIGIDTPESVHPNKDKNTAAGITASDFTKELLDGESVYLEYDKQRKDKYNRDLAYVYHNDKMVNEILLEEGYAVTMEIPPNTAHA
ncbi:MAG: thermonuclease family protein, partial [Clostridiales bacterium]